MNSHIEIKNKNKNKIIKTNIHKTIFMFGDKSGVLRIDKYELWTHNQIII